MKIINLFVKNYLDILKRCVLLEKIMCNYCEYVGVYIVYVRLGILYVCIEN